MSDAIVLPKKKIKASVKSPKNLVIFSKPKVGKTSLLSELEDCLILDLEEGSDFVDAVKLKATSVDDIFAIGKQIIAEGKPYKYIAIDTITALEQICIPYAERLYSKKPGGKNWFKRSKNDPTKLAKDSGKVQYGDILNLPNGYGYNHHREAVVKVIEYVKTLAPRIILLGHIKDIQLGKDDETFTASDLDMTGKLKRIITAQSDAVGYLYRDDENNRNILSFATSDTIICGARPEHLSNQEIVISEKMKDGSFKAYWKEVYID